MTHEVRMPQWGMGMQDGTIVQWLKAVGEPVEEGEPLVEIEAAKVTAILDAPASGMLSKIVATVGDTVAVQGLLGEITV